MVEPSNIKVKGLNEAIRALRAIGVPSAVIGKASQEAGDIVAGKAKTLVPVKSGDLRETIKAKKQARKVIVSAGNNTKVPYANPIHWGWNYDRVNLQQKNIRPRPFFTNALRTTRTQVYEAFFGSMDKLLKEYSNKTP
jgi:HK97 gp10 family phage protein